MLATTAPAAELRIVIAAQRRKELQRALGLPERLSANGLVQAVNALYSREAFLRLAGEHTTKGDG